MARLPVPGADTGQWGQILNDYLSQAHNTDGSLKDASIAETKLDAPTQAKLNTVGGPVGATGPQGPAGAAGPAGATGASGTAGTPGAVGATGANGVAGAQGATGATGVVGPAGATGSQGATGPQGTAGAAGATGATGPAGTDGADGTSVTIAGSVANAAALPGGLGPSDAGDGYITQDDGHLHVWSGTAFSDVGTVRGPAGPTGATGATGTAGAVGATGSAGPQGATGPQGTIGTSGATGATGPNSATDLTFTRTTTTVTVESSTGNDAILPAADSNAGVMSAADKTKLDSIAAGATVNATDAQLRDRSTHTGRQVLSITTLTDGATISTDASVGNTFRVTLGGNRTLANPTNPLDGQMLLFIVTQDGTGGRTLAFDTKFRFGTSLPSITLSAQPNKTDRIGVQYNLPSDTFDVISFAPGF